MKTWLQLASSALVLTLGLAWTANAGTCCDGKACKAKKGATQFKTADAVEWQNRGVAFGNYLNFDKPEIPAPVAPPPPRVAPKFDPIYFDLDKSVLKPEGAAIADKVAEDLKANPTDKVRIIGNCCDLGTNDYNMKLGQRRADAVKKYLVEHGVDATRISTKSDGEEKLVAGPDHRELDRRADCIVHIVHAGK